MDFSNVYESMHLQEENRIISDAMQKFPNDAKAQIQYAVQCGMSPQEAQQKLMGRVNQAELKAQADLKNTTDPTVNNSAVLADLDTKIATNTAAYTDNNINLAQIQKKAELQQKYGDKIRGNTETPTPTETLEFEPNPIEPKEAVNAEIDADIAKESAEALNKLNPELQGEYKKAEDASKKCQKELEDIIKKFKADPRVANIRKTQKVTGLKDFETNYKTFIKAAGGMTLGGKIAICLLTAAVAGGISAKALKNLQLGSKNVDAGGNADNVSGGTPNTDNVNVTNPNADNAISGTSNTNTVNSTTAFVPGTNSAQLTDKAPTIENSIEAQANAKPGDVIQRKDGSKYVLNRGDINWAKQQMTKGKGNETVDQVVEETPQQPTSIVPEVGGSIDATATDVQTETSEQPDQLSNEEINVQDNAVQQTTEPEVSPEPVAEEDLNPTPLEETPEAGGNTETAPQFDRGYLMWKQKYGKQYASVQAQAQARGLDADTVLYDVYKNSGNGGKEIARTLQSKYGISDISGRGMTDSHLMRSMNTYNGKGQSADAIDQMYETDPNFKAYIDLMRRNYSPTATPYEIMSKQRTDSGIVQRDQNGNATGYINGATAAMQNAYKSAKQIYK